MDPTIKISPEQILFFNRQIASMARLNMPIAKGLKVLLRQVSDPTFKQLIEGVGKDLDEGKTLQEALEKYPQSFSSLYLEILRAGESTGNLSVILDELTEYSESMIRVKNRIKDAVLYPAVVSSVIVCFVLYFLFFAAPNFKEVVLKAQQGASGDTNPDDKLPMISKLLFGTSDLLRNPLFSIPLLLVVLGGGGFGVFKLRQMGDRYDDVLFKIPLFGPLFHRATLMKFCRQMRDLLMNGVSMVHALRLATRTVGNNRVQARIETIRQTVEEGGSFSGALAPEGSENKPEVFPETMIWKLQMAEEKGIIEDALGELSREFEMEIEARTSVITNVLSPLLLLVMAVVVFLMFVATYLPLIQSSSGAGR